MPEITIEETQDYELIARVLAQSPALAIPPSSSYLARMEKAKFFLARYNGNPAGVICAQKLQFFLSIIKYLFVLPEYRRRGIAKKLHEKAMEVCDIRFKTPIIIATTAVDNVPVHAIMARYGFRPVATFRSPLSTRRIVMFLKNLRSAPGPGEGIEEINLEV